DEAMIVEKSRVILRFYHAMHAGDGDVSTAAAVRCVEKDFARAILTGDTNSHTEDVDCRCGHPRLFARIFSPIRRAKFGSWWDGRGDSSTADHKRANRELVFRFRDNAMDRWL